MDRSRLDFLASVRACVRGDGWCPPSPTCGPRRAKLALRGWGEGHSPHTELAEIPPHPKFEHCSNFDLSPQAGRGEPSSESDSISKSKERQRSCSRGAERPSFSSELPSSNQERTTNLWYGRYEQVRKSSSGGTETGYTKYGSAKHVDLGVSGRMALQISFAATAER